MITLQHQRLAFDAAAASERCFQVLERSRVARGGHDIPTQTILARYDRSRVNLIRLLPALTELKVFDNSAEGDPFRGVAPAPMLILHLARGTIVDSCDLARTPAWAKPIVAAAMRSSRRSG